MTHLSFRRWVRRARGWVAAVEQVESLQSRRRAARGHEPIGVHRLPLNAAGGWAHHPSRERLGGSLRALDVADPDGVARRPLVSRDARAENSPSSRRNRLAPRGARVASANERESGGGARATNLPRDPVGASNALECDAARSRPARRAVVLSPAQIPSRGTFIPRCQLPSELRPGSLALSAGTNGPRFHRDDWSDSAGRSATERFPDPRNWRKARFVNPESAISVPAPAHLFGPFPDRHISSSSISGGPAELEKK